MEKAGKEYKITYKTYDNERLKKSLFHNKLMYPLYIQVVFDRIPITFKSYYFDLFSKPKYAIMAAGKLIIPDIKEIIKKETTLIEFIIERNYQSFSLDIFKKEYAFFSKDLMDIMEDSFLDYLFVYLHDEGLPSLANIIQKGLPGFIPYDLVRDMKRALNSTLYKKLIENSFYFAPPYLPLYEFTEEIKRTNPLCITVMEWEQQMKEGFTAFFKKQYPDQNIDETLKKIEQWI
ncbi:MAG: hypothetical protein M3Z26_07170 [Bacteroidota bacterium]|nr:hypothetical protein [Bacteroidota bacterium]